MIVYLIGKNKFNKLILPKDPVGNYWISDKDNNLVNIEGNGVEWQVVSNKHSRIVKYENVKYDENKIIISNMYNIVSKITLRENQMYTVLIGNTDDVYTLYCSPVFENNYIQIEGKKGREILIGRDKNNQIVYNKDAISKVHAKMILNNGKWILENFDNKFGTYVNNIPVNKDISVLLNGDVVFILGLKIIIMGNTFFINNPLGNVIINKNEFNIIERKKEIIQLKEEDDDDTDLYNDDDYYFRAPRIKNKIECETVKIDPPPQREKRDEMPMALVLGSSLSMSAIMLTSIFSTIQGIRNGTMSKTETTISLIVNFAMFMSMLMFPILERKWEKRQKEKYEKKRQKKYKEYINSKIKEIDKIMWKQKNLLYKNYPFEEECSDIILLKTERLWEREIEDNDFLTVRLGIGDVPSKINIEYPEKHFDIDEDNLVDMLNTVANKSKILKKVPVVVSLAKQKISGIISTDEQELRRFMQDIIMQLITFHSYNDLKLVFFLKEDELNRWRHFQMLPHIWSNIKDIRFFSDDYLEIKEISRYLEEIITERKSKEQENVDYKLFAPYYLIITDDYKNIKKINIINEIVDNKNNLGFGMICLTDNITKLPNECKTFIKLSNGRGEVFESETTEERERTFSFDDSQRIFFEKISKTISNIPIRANNSKDLILPNSYSFIEMYDVGNIEQLNVYERWKKNQATLSLKAPIGIDSSGMKIYLDIHEKFHGPHGLIAGATGSGKSEFIITYILSLAINYHPDDVAFILIDYKGGGLAGAFQKRDIKLPHLVGTITNIEKVGLQRSLASIQSELRRRQIIFNEARNKTDEGTIDIYKYQKLYHDGVVKTPIPHLLIICDEFAELKQQQEDFMDELISVARIGRSLGVHLILATQKPAGIVNEQIRSNSKFGICLKVQDKEDSNDVIGKPDAAFLKKEGQFYMRVGNDDYFTLGQSAWSGAKYIPSDTKQKKQDKSIEFLSNIGLTIKKIDDSIQKEEVSEGEQLTNIVKYLYNLAKKEKIQDKQLWLENIPEDIYVEDLKEKYKIKRINNEISIVIGEYDDPENQAQGIVQLNLTKNGNLIVFGSADSGKETLISSLIYDAMMTYTSDEIQIYAIDFGSEALKIFKNAPIVGDITFSNDDEKINRFFQMMEKEIKRRKAILSEYNGDYDLYIETSGHSMPMIINIINGYEAFMDIYEETYEDTLLSLTREGNKYGILFILTAGTSSDIRYRLSQNFKQKISLQLNNDDDYYNIFENVGKKRPSKIFGRGLIPLNNSEIYEFQTAKICEPKNWNTFIKNQIDMLNNNCKKFAMPIPTTPQKVLLKDMKKFITNMASLPIGIERNSLDVYKYNFMKKRINIISSKNIEDSLCFIANLIEEIKLINNIRLFIYDAKLINEINQEGKEEEYLKLFKQLKQKDDELTVCIILGLDKFINNLELNNIVFNEELKNALSNSNLCLIFVDNVTKIKNHEYDDWYKEYITGEDGIWVGNGIEDQYLFDLILNKNLVNNCGQSFGYAINSGQEAFVKLLGIKDKGDEDG